MELANKKEDYEEDPIQMLPNINVWSVIRNITDSGFQNDPFYICDISDIIKKHEIWKATMPRVNTHYAVKCNDSKIVLETLAALGAGFDCASKKEIRNVLSLGVHPNRIIYANPTKKPSHLRYAATEGVSMMTFDNENELYKIKDLHPNAKLLIRIKCDDLTALYVLGQKFGCDHETEAAALLQTAFALDLDVIGVAFHVGSGSKNYSIYRKAIESARYVFDVAATVGYVFNLLDMGGGFPGEKDYSIKEIGEIINAALEEYFPDPAINITSEPGRYYVNSAFTLASCIHSLKTTTQNSKRSYAYYIDVSVYGALIPVLFDEDYSPKPLHAEVSDELYPSVIWGPTCDPYDVIVKNIMLPKMNVGNWIVVENAGAYTLSIACEFNGIDTPKLHSVIDEKNWLYLTEHAPFPVPKRRFVHGNSLENYRTGLTGPNKFRTNYF